MNDADLIILLLDGSEPLTEADQSIAAKISGRKVIIIINKIDLPQQLDRIQLNGLYHEPVIELSTLTGAGFPALEEAIIIAVGLGEIKVDDRPMLSRIRHKNSLEQALGALRYFFNGFEQGISEDLLAIDLRSCLTALGEVTGKNVTEEVLRGIFSKFCIGK